MSTAAILYYVNPMTMVQATIGQNFSFIEGETHKEIFSFAVDATTEEAKLQVLSDTFRRFNSDENPLSTDDMQNRILELGLRHTSMSCGDIVRFTNPEGKSEYWLCAPRGWKLI